MSATGDPTRTTGGATSRVPVPVLVAQVVAIGAVLLGAGALAGLAWFRLWDAPAGRVQSGRWLTDETGLRAEFSGTGLYLLLALGTGLVCGVLVALLLARWEVLSLVVLVGSSVAAALLMRHVGLAQSPPDPAVLARTAADGTRLPGALTLPGRTPLVALPLGAVLGFAVLLIAVPKRGHRDLAPPASRPELDADRSTAGRAEPGSTESGFPPPSAG